MKLMTRAESKAAGKKFYYTDPLCEYAHTCGRYVTTGECYDCSLIDGCVADVVRRRCSYKADEKGSTPFAFTKPQ